jgi:hypothetical protein
MRLPAGLTLRVSDQTGILVERAVEENDNYSNFFTSAIGTPYFFTSVIGSWEEKFIVTVSLAPGIKQTLPPFSFDVERSL